MNTLEDDEWRALLRRAAAGELVRYRGHPLPPMPDAELQINTVGQAGEGAIDEAATFAMQCITHFRNSPCFANDRKSLLDFGTGWARIARCFLRDFVAEDMIGADVDPEYLAVCRAGFPGPRFLLCHQMPPLLLRDSSIDFVVGYSVFSHLSEAACRAWISEFARILKPGGMAAVTTRGRWFFDYAAGLTNTDPYSLALARMFPSFEEAKAAYDGGELVHSNAYGVSGSGAREGDFYGETFIPERFARDVLGCLLPLREFQRTDGHPILFFEKLSG